MGDKTMGEEIIKVGMLGDAVDIVGTNQLGKLNSEIRDGGRHTN